jgi:hypothetical protein
MALLELSAQGISFENLLKKSGINKRLEYTNIRKNVLKSVYLKAVL